MRISDWSEEVCSSDLGTERLDPSEPPSSAGLGRVRGAVDARGHVLERDADLAEAVVDDHDVLGALLAGLLVRPALGALEAVDEDRVTGSAAEIGRAHV